MRPPTAPEFPSRLLHGLLLAPAPLTPWWGQTAASYAQRCGVRTLLLRLAGRPELDSDTAGLILTVAGDLSISEDVSERIEAAARREKTDGVAQMNVEQRHREVRLLGGLDTRLKSARLTALARAELAAADGGAPIRRDLLEVAGVSWVLEHGPDEMLDHSWRSLQRTVGPATFSLFCARARGLGLVVPQRRVVRFCPSPAELAENADVLLSGRDNRQRTLELACTATNVGRRARSAEIVDHVLGLQHDSWQVSVALLNAAAAHVSVADLPRLLSGLDDEFVTTWAPQPVAGLDRDGGRWIEQIDRHELPPSRSLEMTRVLVDLHGRDGVAANREALSARMDLCLANQRTVPDEDDERAASTIRTALPLDVDVAEGAPLSDTQVGQVVAFVGEDALRLRVLADVVDGAGHITLGDALATAGALLD